MTDAVYAILHSSVKARFAAAGVQHFYQTKPYRPDNLAEQTPVNSIGWPHARAKGSGGFGCGGFLFRDYQIGDGSRPTAC